MTQPYALKHTHSYCSLPPGEDVCISHRSKDMPLSREWLALRLGVPQPPNTLPIIGAGCDEHQVLTVEQCLDGIIEKKDAAQQITMDGQATLTVLWTCLSDLMVQLPGDLETTVELLKAIASLPPDSHVDWSQLPGFHEVWHQRYRWHLDSYLPWEDEDLASEKILALRGHHEAIGRAESEMYHGGLMPASRGYEVVAMVCQGRKGIDVLLSEIYGWMSGSTCLRHDVDDPLELRSYRYEGLEYREMSMEQHWENWTAQFLAFRQEDSVTADGKALSSEGRKLAGEIYLHMRDGLWDAYGGISSATGV